MDYKFPRIRLGLCCINMSLKYLEDTFTNRKMILKSIQKKGLVEAENIAKSNVIDLLKIIFWNKTHGIDVLRISSILVPHGSNKKLIELFGKEGERYLSLEFLRPYLKLVGHLAKLENVRLTMHVDLFVQLASPNLDIFNKSVDELEMHIKFLDMMEQPADSVIVIHLDGTYCNKTDTIRRFIERFNTLSKVMISRIVLENDEKCYDAADILKVCEILNVPMVFDIFHYYCYKKLHPDEFQESIENLMPRILQTWDKRGIRPKFHLSDQQSGARTGSHSIFVESIPEQLLEIPSKYNKEIDIMIEAKGKEIAISKLYQKYPELKPRFRVDLPSTIPRKALKELKYINMMDEENCKCKLI